MRTVILEDMEPVFLTLPYAVKAEDRKKPFTADMEVASILFLAEGNRSKGGLLKGPLEKISFVSKLCYPLYLFPWSDNCLILDGLGIVSNSIVYTGVPDIDSFISDFKRASTDRELYMKALVGHIKTFESFTGQNEVPIDSVIMDKNLLSELSQYIRKEYLKGQPEEKILTPMFVDEIAQEKAGKLVNECERVRSDTEGLKNAVFVLVEETKFHSQKIQAEIEQVKEKYATEINSIKPDVDVKVGELNRKHETELLKVVEGNKKELAAALKEQAKYERELRELLQKAGKCAKQEADYKRRKNKDVASYWNRERNKYRKEASAVKKEISALSIRTKKMKEESELEVKELNEKYQGMIEGELNKIKKLEILRESNIDARKKEADELNLETSTITSSIEKLIESKRQQKSRIEEMGIQLKLDETKLIGIPFYIVRYESEKEARYNIYPPMMVQSYEGILKSVKRAISVFKPKISFLLEPISPGLAEYFTKDFLKAVYKEEKLLEEMFELGSSGNLLKNPNLREALTKGLQELNSEGWISDNELLDFQKVI